MKALSVTLLLVCLAQPGCGQTDAERESERLRKNAATMERLQDELALKKGKVRYVRAKHGDVVAGRLEMCLMYPPQQEKNKVACKKLVDRTDKEMAAEPKW